MAKIVLRLAAGLIALYFTTLAAGAQDWITVKSSTFAAPSEGQKAKNGLPDGYEVRAVTGDIARAWYTKPTKRYRHAILGDAVEAGGLRVVLRNGEPVNLTLAKNLVFEDRTPRLIDLDGDGRNELITLLSSSTKGAAIAVYGMRDGKLQQVSRTPFVGRTNRWRNIAGIADYNGDGRVEIAEVITPHIGGTLKFWTWRDGRLQSTASAKFFSNHAIGSPEQRLSATADFDGDGRADIAVPGGNRRRLYLIGFTNSNKLKQLAEISLESEITRPILLQQTSSGAVLKLGLANGSYWIVQRK